MKTKLNILCVIIISLEIIQFISAFATVPDNISKYAYTSIVRLSPNEISDESCVIMKDRWGKDVKIWPTEVRVKLSQRVRQPQIVKGPFSQFPGFLKFILICAMDICLFYLIIVSFVKFIKVIINVNKGIIFDWKNVKLLNYVAVCMLMLSVYSIAANLINDYHQSELLSVANYTVGHSSLYYATSGTGLFSACLILLMAEIFAIGLKQKEELDLTI